MQKGKIKLLIRQISHIGFVNGVKSFIYINMQKRWGRKIYSIHHKKLGKEKFYLRSCSTDDYIANSILGKRGGYDFLNLMPDMVNNCRNVIDGGANIGIFSRMIYEMNPNVNIAAVELESTNYEMLKMNTAYTKVHCLLGGIWNDNTGLSIVGHVEGNEAGFSAQTSLDDDYEVQGYTIDKIMEIYGMDYIDILKLDIEGAEIEVFDDSSEQWLDKTRMVIIELHDRYRMGCSVAVYGRMEKHGFKCTNYDENVIFYKNKNDLGTINV